MVIHLHRIIILEDLFIEDEYVFQSEALRKQLSFCNLALRFGVANNDKELNNINVKI